MPLSWVEIDLAALRYNFEQVRTRMAPNTRILGVVKSDAYGHGMVPVARELVRCGVHFLAVSKHWEAMELRERGIDLPILVLLGLEASDMEEAVRLGIRPALFRMDHARLLSQAATRLNLPARIHLKVDTGMGRLGVPHDKVTAFLDELLLLPGVRLEGLISHFAVADESDKSFSEVQMHRFNEVLNLIAARGHAVPHAHMSNSAGLLDFPHAHYQLVRPGIMLYGSLPSEELQNPSSLKPVMRFKSRILQLKTVPQGRPIGYGRTFVTTRESRIATLPVGYDDGYPRLLSNQGQVLIRGKRAPLVGRVSMNMITVDVTHIPEAAEDDEAVLLGEQGDEGISAEEIAHLCRTISYELYCRIGRHHHRLFLNAATPDTTCGVA